MKAQPTKWVGRVTWQGSGLTRNRKQILLASIRSKHTKEVYPASANASDELKHAVRYSKKIRRLYLQKRKLKRLPYHSQVTGYF